MIDLEREELITLAEASKMLPGRPSLQTLWRWRRRPSRASGGRTLEVVRIGGKVFTSRSALARFAAQEGGDVSPTIRTPRQRDRDIERAERELAEG
jgi:hypothetical protein